jgi:hypothetical protein
MRPDGTPIDFAILGGRSTVDGFDVSGDISNMELHDMEDSHVPWMGDISSPRQEWPAGLSWLDAGRRR